LRDRSSYSMSMAAKEAVLNGEVALDDVRLLLTQTPYSGNGSQF
jgi:hypothetical protein